jgi:hypothetical protein
MAPKRSSEQTQRPRKSKKARTAKITNAESAPAQPALGAPNLLAQAALLLQKDEDELDLEEAVFGKRSGERETDVWALAKEDERRRGGSDSDDPFGDEVDYEDEEETGLERLRDENVRFSFPFLPFLAVAHFLLSLCSSSSSTLPPSLPPPPTLHKPPSLPLLTPAPTLLPAKKTILMSNPPLSFPLP